MWLALPGRPVAWRAQGPPFLTALELSRQAVELARAVELGEPRFSFEPAGVRPALTLELKTGKGRLGPGAPFAVEARRWRRRCSTWAQALAVAIAERSAARRATPTWWS